MLSCELISGAARRRGLTIEIYAYSQEELEQRAASLETMAISDEEA